MAPPKKRPPQRKSGPKRPNQGKRPQPARKPDASGALESGNGPADESGAAVAEDAAAVTPSPSSKAAEERKARREAARQERIAAARRREQAKRRKRAAIIVLLIAVLAAGTWYSIQRSRDRAAAFAAAADAAGCTDIESFDDEGQRHLASGETYDQYETNPPTSGPHRAQPAVWGSYREAPTQEAMVHNLEHGGIVIHYKDLTDEQVDEVDAFADSYLDGVIAAPNPDIEAPIALAAWRHMQECEELNTTAIEGFIQDRCDKGPEKVGTTCARE